MRCSKRTTWLSILRSPFFTFSLIAHVARGACPVLTVVLTMKQVTALYFASARDATDMESEKVAAAGWTLADLREHLVATHGEKLAQVLQSAVYAVDMEYAGKVR